MAVYTYDDYLVALHDRQSIPWSAALPHKRRGIRRAHIDMICDILTRQSPPTVEARLWVGVIKQALCDATDYSRFADDEDRLEARQYLRLPIIPACEILGLDSRWVRGLIRRIRLLVVPYRRGNKIK